MPTVNSTKDTVAFTKDQDVWFVDAYRVFPGVFLSGTTNYHTYERVELLAKPPSRKTRVYPLVSEVFNTEAGALARAMAMVAEREAALNKQLFKVQKAAAALRAHAVRLAKEGK